MSPGIEDTDEVGVLEEELGTACDGEVALLEEVELVVEHWAEIS